MRISLHIVVALLLIALIYREILKGILPPVCGNPLQGMHCLCLPLSFPLAHTLTRIPASGFVAVLLPRHNVSCFNSCCLPDNSPTRLSRSAGGGDTDPVFPVYSLSVSVSPAFLFLTFLSSSPIHFQLSRTLKPLQRMGIGTQAKACHFG